MKNKSEKIIIYDSYCPLCNWYTGEFIKTGILPEDGRMPFDCITEQAASQIDAEKSRHEIPLIDTNGGKTLYGLDSLIYLLSQRFTFIGKLMSQDPIYSFFRSIYAVISYNRRIISGADKQKERISCEPDFNLKFRLIFIFFSFIVASYVAMEFGEAFAVFLPVHYQFMASFRMLLITSTGWLVSAAVSYCFLNHRTWIDYLGHLATIMLVGVLLFLPWMLLSKLLAGVYPITLLIGVIVSLIVMGLQHKKRVEVLQIRQRWSLIWAINMIGGASIWGLYLFG